MIPTVVSVCGDPGGARALAPVLRLVRDDGRVRLVNSAYNEAVEILKGQGIPVIPLTGGDGATASAFLASHEASCLLAATSCNGVDLEKQFVAAAAGRIPSLAVLDFWSGYGCRFSDANGRLIYVPDIVAVMDDRAREELTAAGVSAARIAITGQPAFDSLAEQRDRFSHARRREVRRLLGVGADDVVVLFLSQPLADVYRATEGDPRFLGYDEGEVLRLVTKAVGSLRDRTSSDVRLMIRPHPREPLERFSSLDAPFASIIASNDVDGRESAMAADLVVGMNSVLLLEACFLGCIVVSVQPGLRHRDKLPSNEWGASTPVYQADDLDGVLASLLFDPEARAHCRSRVAQMIPTRDAARQVATRMYTALNLDSSK